MKKLPASVEMERAALACVLLKPEYFKELDVPLESADFSEACHRQIWQAMAELWVDNGTGIDLRTLQAKLEERGLLEAVGGIAYLAGLDVELPDLSGFSLYAANLRQLRRRRELIAEMIRAGDALGNGSNNLEDRLEKVRAAAEAALRPAAAPQAVCLADVDPENVSFLWRPRIPRRKLTILEGDPGQGKSFITAAIATAGSLGRGLPEIGEFPPFKTLFFTAEDGLGDTLRPRLDAMEADCRLVYAHDQPVNLSEPQGFEEMEREIRRVRPGLVVIDPIVAYLGTKTDAHRANHVRSILAPLAKIAEQLDCAVLAVRHLAKSKGGRSIYAGLGSIDFTAAARSVLLAGSDPEGSERALVHIKCNVAEMAPSVGYEIREGRFLWSGESTLTASQILSAEASDQECSASAEAEEFLLAVLADGPVKTKEVLSQAREVGVSERVLRDAKRRLEVRAERDGFGRGGAWSWKLKSA